MPAKPPTPPIPPFKTPRASNTPRALHTPPAPAQRIACLLIPDLPLRAELRAHPDLAGAPLALASGPQARAEVVAVSPEAAAAGVHPACSVTHARSLCSSIHVRVTSPALDQATRQTLRDIALSFSPRVAPAPRASGFFACEGAVFLDASGVSSLFRSEAGFAAALAARSESLGLPGVVAIASSRWVAQWVARRLALPSMRRENPGPGEEIPANEGAGSCFVLAPGEEEKSLASYPIDLLSPGDDIAQALTRFGVHTVGDLLRLPRRSLAQRLGPEILRLIERARGREAGPPLPKPHGIELREAVDLDYAISELEPLCFVLRGLLSRLSERLALRGLAWGAIDLSLDLAGGGHDRRRIGLAAPTRDTRVLLRLVSQALEHMPAAAPIEGVAVATEARPERADQLDFFRPAGPDPNALDHTLAELESLCGAERVGSPAVMDDHRPDAFELKPFSGASLARDGSLDAGRAKESSWGKKTPLQGEAATRASSSLVVRALRPPIRAEVRMNRGRPSEIRSAVASGPILNAAGPWRITGRWWSEEGRYAFDYFDIQVGDGSILRLCFDWVKRKWQVDAIYD